jgi:hypothetical protein
MAGEDPDAVDLGQMPRQHRRRREKKLMTIDEVNEKFPLIKYKTWRSTQAEKGLPTAGGIASDSAASRPASIRNLSRESKDEAVLETSLTQQSEPPVAEQKEAHNKAEEVGASDATPSTPRPKTATSTVPDTPVQKVTSNEGDEDDDHIQTAVPAEQLPDPGDTCAICIDTLEDDDDVRGLTCGHAFHASCVDPWLTSRRACCPLCKADYYVPKPRPEGADAQAAQQPVAPEYAFMRTRGDRRPRMILPGRFMSIVYDERDRYGFPRVVRDETPTERRRRERREMRARERDERQRQASEVTQTAAPEVQQEQQSSWRSRLRLPRFGARNNASEPEQHPAHQVPGQEQNAAEISPAQLEAGQQTSTTRP